MSGHNKWTQIKRKKEVVDGKRSREFGKLARLISIAVKEAGGNTDHANVKMLVEKAKATNMPKENIERALRKGAGVSSGSLSEIVFELYGPGGVAIIAHATTDNKNRTYPEVRHLVSELGYTLAEPGSALWAFSKNAEGYVPTTMLPLAEEEKEKLGVLIEALEAHDDIEEVVTNMATS